MTNVIDARDIFATKRHAPIKGFKNYGAYRDTVEYSQLLSEEVADITLDILEYHGIDISNDQIINDFAFINMFVQAAVDRSLGLSNELCTVMDDTIKDWESTEVKVE